MMRWMVPVAALLLPLVAHAQDKAGDTYDLVAVTETSSADNRGSSGSSFDRNTLRERVIRVGDDGIELEYDLPADATASDRATNWQFPARVLRPRVGPLRLLNATELEARVDGWLKRGGMTREACGRWIFTWNAFKIECDPQSVLDIVGGFDLRADLRDGALYKHRGAKAPVALKRSPRSGGAVFAAELTLDPDHVRQAQAEGDVIVAQLTGEPLTLEEALRARAGETVSGTITVRFETDAAGNPVRRVTVTRSERKSADGRIETQTATETLERKPGGKRESPRTNPDESWT